MTRTFSTAFSGLPWQLFTSEFQVGTSSWNFLLTATADQAQRLASIESSVVEGTPRNSACELAGAWLQQPMDVRHRGKSTRYNHRNGGRIGKRDGGVEVQSLEQAVSGDIRMNDGGAAGVLE